MADHGIVIYIIFTFIYVIRYDAAHAILSGKNIDCTYLLENDNDIAESILRAADEQKCDGIVLGSRGMGVLEGLFRNSVSSVIAENANVPVTIVK